MKLLKNHFKYILNTISHNFESINVHPNAKHEKIEVAQTTEMMLLFDAQKKRAYDGLSQKLFLQVKIQKIDDI